MSRKVPTMSMSRFINTMATTGDLVIDRNHWLRWPGTCSTVSIHPISDEVMMISMTTPVAVPALIIALQSLRLVRSL